jgi:hypothetical protein
MLVGVPSHRHAIALQRREAIRELCAGVGTSGVIGPSSADTKAGAAASSSAASTAITLRFVMAQDQADVDRNRSDVWLFDLPAARRAKKTYGLEKYLLSNRFLRTAAARKDTPLLVVLADDDTPSPDSPNRSSWGTRATRGGSSTTLWLSRSGSTSSFSTDEFPRAEVEELASPRSDRFFLWRFFSASSISIFRN